jgi:tetratricopeptide (TPR) repeat protein
MVKPVPGLTLSPKLIITIAIGLLLLGGSWNISSRNLLLNASLDALLQHGIRAYRDGAIDQALLRFQEATEKAPGDATVQYMLAQTLEAMGREDDAIAHYENTIRLNSGMAEPHYNLAVIYNRRKDPLAAIEELRLALRLHPDFIGARLMLGSLYTLEERFDEAVTELEKLFVPLNLDRSVAIPARNMLGRAYLGQEKEDLARQQWEEVLRLDPHNQEAREQLEKFKL